MLTTIKKRMAQAVSDFIKDGSRWDCSLSGTGPIYRLEQRFCELLEKKFAVMFCNATAALWAVFKALEIDDSPLPCPALTWGGSLAGALLLNNKPVWVDVREDDLTIDCDLIEQAIGFETKAVLGVDVFGSPCRPQIRALTDKHNLFYIQDCAAGLNSFAEKHTGFFANVAVFSFGFNKFAYGGEGSIVVTDHEFIFERLIHQFHHVQRQLMTSVPQLAPNEFFLNLRPNPLAAVAVNAAFEDVLEYIESHRDDAMRVLRGLSEAGLSNTLIPPMNIKPNFHTVTFEPGGPIPEIVKWLTNHAPAWSVISFPYSAPLYQHRWYQKHAADKNWARTGHCYVAEEQCRSRVALRKN